MQFTVWERSSKKICWRRKLLLALLQLFHVSGKWLTEKKNTYTIHVPSALYFHFILFPYIFIPRLHYKRTCTCTASHHSIWSTIRMVFFSVVVFFFLYILFSSIIYIYCFHRWIFSSTQSDRFTLSIWERKKKHMQITEQLPVQLNNTIFSLLIVYYTIRTSTAKTEENEKEKREKYSFKLLKIAKFNFIFWIYLQWNAIAECRVNKRCSKKKKETVTYNVNMTPGTIRG